jgi:hypothetical protein
MGSVSLILTEYLDGFVSITSTGLKPLKNPTWIVYQHICCTKSFHRMTHTLPRPVNSYGMHGNLYSARTTEWFCGKKSNSTISPTLGWITSGLNWLLALPTLTVYVATALLVDSEYSLDAEIVCVGADSGVAAGDPIDNPTRPNTIKVDRLILTMFGS